MKEIPLGQKAEDRGRLVLRSSRLGEAPSRSQISEEGRTEACPPLIPTILIEN